MSRDAQSFVDEITRQVKPLFITYSRAGWEAATTGTEAANKKEEKAQIALMRYWADARRYRTARELHQAGGARDPLLARQLKLIYLSTAKAQQDEETIQKIAKLETAVRMKYYNFRGRVGGAEKTDNELEDILLKSKSSGEVREAWEASKQVGVEVAAQVRELARVRNAAARRQGFRDHFQKSLTLDEIDETELLTLFDRLERDTRKPFDKLKRRIDRERARHFGIAESELRPWHFGDRFFQRVPPMGELDMDALFEGKDPVALATATYDGIALEVRDILGRSDLYPRPGKNQHAFCVDMDHEGDIRTLNNLKADHHWTETLLHELGHAVYDKYIERSLPWILREPPHTLSTEAIALLMGSLTYDREWLEQIAGVKPSEARKISRLAQERERAARLVFTRWCLVMTYFELAMYGDPERDLDTLWWDLVSRFQLLRRVEGRKGPDWAAKFHVALAPVYYHNYELGYLSNAQIQNRLRKQAGGIVGRKQAGQWLMQRVFRPGATADWATHIAQATGEPLNARYFVRSLR